MQGSSRGSNAPDYYTPLHTRHACHDPENKNEIAKNEDDDSVIARFPVLLKPALPGHRQLFVLQYPNSFSATESSDLRLPKISEMRVKLQTGLIEVDVPIDAGGQQYDRRKGIAWGAALKRSMELRGQRGSASLGLAGGFGVGAPPSGRGPGGVARKGQSASEEVTAAAAAGSWVESLKQDKVLKTKTLGGRFEPERKDGDPRFVIAVFQDQNIHLTPVSHIAQLRPSLHHLDAATEQERQNRSTGTASTVAGSKEGGARAITMTLKAAMDDNSGAAIETMTDRLRAVQGEGWRRMKYSHQESETSWESYMENLVITPQVMTDDVEEAQKENKETDGMDLDDDTKKADPPDADSKPQDTNSASLPQMLPRLRTSWNEDDLLRAVAGLSKDDRKPGEEAAAAAELAAKQTKEKMDQHAAEQQRIAAAAIRQKEKEREKAAKLKDKRDVEASETAAPTASAIPALARCAARGAARRGTRGGTRGARGTRGRGGAAGFSAANAMQLD